MRTAVGLKEQSLNAEAVKYEEKLRLYVMRRVRNPQDAQDVMQDMHLRFLRSRVQLDMREPLAYLYRAAHNEVHDFMGRRKPTEPLSSNDDEAPSQDDHMELIMCLQAALDKLKPKQAEVLVLHYCEGLSQEEIAQRLGLSMTSIDKYVSRGKLRMRELLNEWRQRAERL